MLKSRLKFTNFKIDVDHKNKKRKINISESENPEKSLK